MNRCLPVAIAGWLAGWAVGQVPQISSNGVMNAASYNLTPKSLAPGAIAVIFGSNLTDGTSCLPPCGPSVDPSTGQLSTTMSGAQVKLKVSSSPAAIPAPIFYATPNQLGIQIPAELVNSASSPPWTASVDVTVAGKTGSALVSLWPNAPGIFTTDQSGRGQGAVLINSTGELAAPLGSVPGLASRPAKGGEIITVYCTGLGDVTNPPGTGRRASSSPLSVTVAPTKATFGDIYSGIDAQVLFSGLAPGFVGLYQVNIQVPANAPSGDRITLMLSSGGALSNPVTIAVDTLTPQTYRQGGGPPGGRVTAFALDPRAASIFAGTETSGIFKTTDGGATWAAINNGLANLSIQNLAIDPLHPGTLYAGTKSGGVFKSTNSGGTWVNASAGLPTAASITGLAIDGGGAVVYASADSRIFRSTNAADSWEVAYVPPGFPFTSGSVGIPLVADAVHPATVYGGFLNAILTSTDGGVHWSKIQLENFLGPLTSLIRDPVNPSILYAGCACGGILRIQDAGASWTDLSLALPYAPIDAALALDPRGNGVLYAGDDRGIVKSTDGGATWTFTSKERTVSLLVDSGNPLTVYAGTYGVGVMKSGDGAATWGSASSGLAATSAVLAVATDPSHGGALYAGTSDGGVSKSPDGGGSWAFANTGLADKSVYSLAVDPSSPLTVYAGNGLGTDKSTDGGRSWSPVLGGYGGPTECLAVDGSNPATIYAGHNGIGLLKSTDRGKNWSVIFQRRTFAVAVDPVVSMNLFAGTDAGVFKSADGGQNWTTGKSGTAPEAVYALVIDGFHSGTVYAGTATTVLQSSDGGANWTALDLGIGSARVNALAIEQANTNIVYAGTTAGVLKTIDGGRTWTLSLSGVSVSSLAVDPGSLNTVYAGTSDSGVLKTLDGTASWQPTGAASTALP